MAISSIILNCSFKWNCLTDLCTVHKSQHKGMFNLPKLPWHYLSSITGFFTSYKKIGGPLIFFLFCVLLFVNFVKSSLSMKTCSYRFDTNLKNDILIHTPPPLMANLIDLFISCIYCTYMHFQHIKIAILTDVVDVAICC